MNYLIIGNSISALSAMENIRKYDKKGDITVVTKEKYRAYSRPLISYLLKDKVNEEKMYLRNKDFYEKLNINLICEKEAISIDKNKKKVGLNDGSTLAYDKLLIATGSNPFVPLVKGMDMDKTFTFWTMDDAYRLQSSITKDTRVVIVGAGLIGLKAAEGLQGKCSSIKVIDMANRVLPTILDDKGAKIIENAFANGGVTCILNNSVSEVEYKEDGTYLTLADGGSLVCDILIMAVGVRSNTRLAQSVGIKVEHGIVTDDNMQTSEKDIYAVGDCSESFDITDEKRKVLALWGNGAYQGKIAGAAMAGANEIYNGSFPINAIGFMGIHIITCGILQGDNEIEYYENNQYKKLVTQNDKLKGFVLVGEVENAGIYTSIIKNKINISSLTGDILKPCISMFDQEEKKKRLMGGVR